MNTVKTKGTSMTAPLNFQNKCCSVRAERQLLNIPLRWAACDFLPMACGPTLSCVRTLGVQSPAAAVTPASGAHLVRPLPSLPAERRGESTEQPAERPLPPGGGIAPRPVSLRCSMSHLWAQRDLLDRPRASVGRSHCSPPGAAAPPGRGSLRTSPWPWRESQRAFVGSGRELTS